jgi:TnpA family transposase
MHQGARHRLAEASRAARRALSTDTGAPINATLILDHWDHLLHFVASITKRSQVTSTIMGQRHRRKASAA